MKKLLIRIFEGTVAALMVIFLIHLLAISIWLVMDIVFIWENPITVVKEGLYNMWVPTIERGWDCWSIFTIILWFSFGLFITSIKIPENGL